MTSEVYPSELAEHADRVVGALKWAFTWPPEQVRELVDVDAPFWPDRVNIFHRVFLINLARNYRDLMAQVTPEMLLAAVVAARPDLAGVLAESGGHEWFRRRVAEPMREELIDGHVAR